MHFMEHHLFPTLGHPSDGKKENRYSQLSFVRQLVFLLLILFSSCLKDEGLTRKPPVKSDRSFAHGFLKKNSVQWPKENWQYIPPEKSGINQDALQALEKFAFEGGESGESEGNQTDALLIINNGKLVYEKYANGYNRNSPHNTRAISKSFINALVGSAILENRFQLDDPVASYYAPLNRASHKKITIKNLLEMSSGIDWDEGRENSSVKSSVLNMLFAEGSRNMALYAAGLPISHEPGSYWYYSSGDTNILSALLKERLGSEYSRYPWDKIFDPLGMKNVTWERDVSGTFVGSSYVYMRAQDLAKFAYLYLNDGIWNGKRILPVDWVRYTTTVVDSYYTTPLRKDMYEDNPGAHVFLNIGDSFRDVDRPWPEAPADLFVFRGQRGQFAFVIPSLDLVIVRYGDDREQSLDINKFLKLVIAILKTEAED